MHIALSLTQDKPGEAGTHAERDQNERGLERSKQGQYQQDGGRDGGATSEAQQQRLCQPVSFAGETSTKKVARKVDEDQYYDRLDQGGPQTMLGLGRRASARRTCISTPSSSETFGS